MQKQDYLQLVKPFIKYLSEAWSGHFPHTFEIRDTSWIRYRNGNANWHVNNLKEAYQHYWWDNDAEYVTSKVTGFRNAWLKALAIQNPVDSEAAAKLVVYDIFKWGGVNACKKKAEQTENIREHITQALDILLGESDDIPQFSESGFYMNSGYTKVYAILNSQLIIYDGRVGAALGLIARNFLENTQLPKNTHNELVPLLRFPFKIERASGNRSYISPTQSTRNPSLGQYTFDALNTPSKNHALHAKWMVRASWIVEAMLKQLNDSTITSRNIESALFMVGYKVTS
ncbi:hypothetical protein IHQ56_08300 [Methylobacillus flagellatus]|uniref:hypothetical protein n=1 Tax=Methylobacillus flagellatus TaxID=405 RepID=UPI002854095E|nr:hypothetical protein [Methylobacillus flagellatus]MDR5171814.1 hypothetical protein [Methylobacillus flagellatus]